MNTELLKARQTKYVAYATLYILVALAVVTVANILADRYDKSYDATANKQYSLSEQTIKVVKGLKQDATITYFAQDSQFSQAKDKLDLYANLSPKLHVVYVDPDKKPLVATQAGFKNLNTAIVQIGANKNEAKSISEEDLDRRHHPRSKEHHTDGLLCYRKRRASDRRFWPHRLFATQGIGRQR